MSDPNLNPQPLPPQQPQPPQYGAYQQPQPAGYNTMSIVAFILAFFVSIVGIILGFVALSQIKRTGEQGRGLALAAVIIGFVEVAIGILIFIFVLIAVGIAASQGNTTY
jgi:peptidyl-prolyl cis-trans isomerase B (cyclophilin B)